MLTCQDLANCIESLQPEALPRDVASWWKDRARLEAAAEGATIAHAREVDGRIVYEL